jgi:peptidoglycan/xylan/chitin deacetylase (PgdA/CDA1 family)
MTERGVDNRLLVLLYHNVGRPPRGRGLPAHYVEPELLRAQIRCLQRAGHTFLTAARALSWLEGAETDLRRPVLLTFDDGLVNLHARALPVLAEEGVPALVFVVAGQVGGRTAWEPNPAHRDNPLLTWEQLIEMQAAGVAIGSHTLTHPHLTDLPPEQVVEELRESKRRLENGLGTAVETLAYPYGDFNAQAELAAREAGYRAGFSTRLGLNTPETDRLALRRVNVRRWSYLPLFQRKLRRAYRLP